MIRFLSNVLVYHIEFLERIKMPFSVCKYLFFVPDIFKLE